MAMTNRQLDVLDFIKRFIADNGYSPTIREIASGMGYKSPSTAQEHLRSLVTNGIITMDKQKSRTIELLVQNEYTSQSSSTVNVPILENTYDQINKKFIEIPKFMLNDYDPQKIYVFKQDNSYYIVNSALTFKGKPSLTVQGGLFGIEQKPSSEIFGNIIGEYKIY